MRKQRGDVLTNLTRSIFQFPYMMGPASDQVGRSEKWAICFGNEIDYWFENLIEYGIRRSAGRNATASGGENFDTIPDHQYPHESLRRTR